MEVLNDGVTAATLIAFVFWLVGGGLVMQLDHYDTQARAEAYLAAEGFTEVAINTWRDDHGNVVHVQFPQEVTQ